MFLNGYPYTDFHELNLDFLLKSMDELKKAFASFTASNSLIFAEPLLHDLTKSYAKNTIVLDADGNAYISLQAVPSGVQLSDSSYWLMVFNFEEYTEKANKNFTVNYLRDTTRAPQAYVIGDWIVLDDVLYKVTAAIATDELLVIGTNIVHFTIEQFLKDFITTINATVQQYKNDIDASELAYRQQLAQDIADTTASLQAQLDAAISGATVDSEVINARVAANGYTYGTLKAAIDADFTALTGALNIVDFCNTKVTANGEIMKMYLKPNTRYTIYVPVVKDGAFSMYEYYNGGQTRTLIYYDNTTGIFTLTTDANHEYLRLYGSSINTEMTVVCMVAGTEDLNNNYRSILSSEDAVISHSQLNGYSNVITMPPNRVYKFTNDVVASDISNMPMYGRACTLAIIASDVRKSVTPFDLCIYSNEVGDCYIGFRTASIIWTRVDKKDILSLFQIVTYVDRVMSSNGEILRFSPTAGVTYDIYITSDATEVDCYEFLDGGSYNTIKISQAPEDHIVYTADADVDYFRFYANTATGTGRVTIDVIEKDKNPYVLGCLDDNYNDMFTCEISAVRKITCIGDSLMSGYYSEGPNGPLHGRNLEYSWPAIMARKNGIIMQHASTSGATTKTWWTAGGGKGMVTPSTRSQLYIMGIGTNDYKDIPDADITSAEIGSIASVDFSDYNNNLDDFWGNYCKIIQYVHDLAPDAQIICLTIPSPRPETSWKETAIREICEVSAFSSFVSLCDLVADYRRIVDCTAIAAHRWEGHFTPIGYANSAAALEYCLSDTMRKNKDKFITLPEIDYDETVIVYP